MPTTELNNRSKRRAAKRLESKRRIKQEKKLMKSSPNGYKYNAKKSRRYILYAAQKARVVVIEKNHTPIVTVVLPPTVVSEDITMAKELLVHNQLVTETNPLVKKDHAPKEQDVIVGDQMVSGSEDAVDEQTLAVETEEFTAEIKVFLDLSETKVTDTKEEEVPLNLDGEKEDPAVKEITTFINEVDMTQNEHGISQQDIVQTNVSLETVISLINEKKTDKNWIDRQESKELDPIPQFVLTETPSTNNSHAASVEDKTSTPAKKKNIVSRLYKKTLKACDQFIEQKINPTGKVNRIGVISDEKSKPKLTWKKLWKKN